MFYGSFHKFHKPDNSFYKDYEIQGYFGQFGIVHFKHSHQTVDGDTIETPPVLIWAVPPNYDNIFRWGWKEVFILSERGKVGAVRCVGDTYEWIVPCEYNAIEEMAGSLFLVDTVKRYAILMKHIGSKSLAR